MAFATTNEDTELVSSAPRSETRSLATMVTFIALSLIVVVCIGMLLWQRSDLHQVRADLARANHANNVGAALSADLSTKLSALTAQVHTLQGGTGASADSLAGMRTNLTTLQSQQQKDEQRLKYICDKSAVQSEESNIWGQQSADPNTAYNYYANLTSVMDAICGSPVPPTN